MNKSLPLSSPFIWLYVITFLFFSANPILNIVVPLRGEAEGASNAEIGVMMGAYMMSSMLFRPWAGTVVHRFGPLPVLRVLLMANFVILALYTTLGLEWYFAIRAIQGVTTAFFSLALQMGIVDTLPEKERSQGISLYLLAGMLPTVIGPFAALSMWNWSGMNAFTASMIFIGLSTGILGYTARLPSGLKGRPEAKHQEISMTAQLSKMWTNRAFLVCSTAMLIASVGFGAVVTFIALYAKQSGVGHAGLYLMLQASVMVLCRFALRKKVPSDGEWHPRFVVGLLLSMTVGLQLLALSVYCGTSFMYAASVMIGLGMALLYPTLMTYLTFVLPVSSRNTLIGMFIAVSDLGVVLGNMAMGPIADRWSYSSMYTVCACLSLAAVAVVLVCGRRLTKIPG